MSFMNVSQNRKIIFTAFSILSFYFLGIITVTDIIDYNIISVYGITIPDFSFAAVGDWGCNSNTKETVNSILKNNPNLVLSLGDNSYKNTGDCWLRSIDPIFDKTKLVIGNHDDQSSSLLNQYMNKFNLDKQYYSFNYQNVHFIVMATELSYVEGSAQYDFVKKDLEQASTNPDINWIVVAQHKPHYSSACGNQDSCQGLEKLRANYHPLFDKYDVDLVLMAHAHNYQRFFPLNFNSLNPENPIIADSNKNNYNNLTAPIFVITGTGGVSHYKLTDKQPYSVFQQDSRFGYTHISISNNGQTLIGKFFANDGPVVDQFTINKPYSISNPPPTNPTCQLNEHLENGICVPNTPIPPNTQTKYKYDPFLILTGNTKKEILNNPQIQLTTFTISLWFNTDKDFSNSAFLVNKGGYGSDISGQNMNYGIWMTFNEKIRAGFETKNGIDNFVTSPKSYSDKTWHNVVVTYDKRDLKLFIDGIQVATAANIFTNPDDTGSQSLSIGSNSLIADRFFTGLIDELRIWNRPLSISEIEQGYENGIFNPLGQVVYISANTLSASSSSPSQQQ